MTNSRFIFASLLAATISVAGLSISANEAKESPKVIAADKADAPKTETPKKEDRPKDEKHPRPDGPRPERGPGDGPRPDGPRPDGPRGEFGPRPPAMNTGKFEQFSADELRVMIEAVEVKNKRLAEKMKERFAETLTKKPTKLTPEQIAAAMGIFEDREPHLAGRLKEYLKNNPDRVGAMLAFQWPRLEKTIELKNTDRALYDAQTAEILKQGEGRGLAWKLREAVKAKNAAEVTRLQEELKTKFLEQHTARQAIRRLELDRMNEKISKLSEEITAEDAQVAEMIAKHLSNTMKWAESEWDRGGRRGPERGDREDKPEKSEKPD